MLKGKFCKIVLLFLLLLSTQLNAKNIIEKIGYTNSGKIYIKTKYKIKKYNSFILTNPNRIVVDVFDSRIGFNAVTKYFPNVKNVRNSSYEDKTRIVFDLSAKPLNFSSNLTEPNIVHLTYNYSKSRQELKNTKKPIIMIDAGHGGKDPGAIGRYLRSKEKVITLSYAKLLKNELQKTGKYKVYLTRSDDRFLELRERVKKARKRKADLFISLHANSSVNSKAKGFSIYTLSEKASDKEAAKLARRENSADGIGDINFKNANREILSTLIDLSQRSSMNYSSRFADLAIRNIKKQKVETISNTHRFAGFAVLTAPDMVSILIELGYISNRSEEKTLNSYQHKIKVINGLKDAINSYFKFKN